MKKLVSRLARVTLLILTTVSISIESCGIATADVTSRYLASIKPSLVLVAAQQGGEVSFGTGFCIYAKNGVSYFLTDHHVIASETTDAVYRTVQIVLPSDPTKRYPATVVKAGSVINEWPPDLAVLSAPVGTLPALRFSTQRPLEGTDVGIAGFPAFQLQIWLQQSKGRELRSSFHQGRVNALTLGDFYVQYDALTDQGNSGGPLFDTTTGAVYGVVDESVKGSTVSNNLAISDVEIRRFIASLALPLRAAPVDKRLYVAAEDRGVADRSDACTAALERFSKDVNELENADARATSGTTRHGSMTVMLMARYGRLKAAYDRHLIKRDLAAIKASGAVPTAQLAEAVYTDVVDTSPQALATSRLKDDTQKFDTLGDCSTDS